MNTSGEVADLMVKEGIQITESAAKLVGLGAKNLAAIVIALLNEDTKLQGKTNLKHLLKSDKPLCILQIKEKDLKTFNAEAKKYGVLFTAVTDKNSKTGLCDIIAKQDDVTKLNYLMEKLGYAAPETEHESEIHENNEHMEKNSEEASKKRFPRVRENQLRSESSKYGATEKTDSGIDNGKSGKPSVRKKVEEIKEQQKKERSEKIPEVKILPPAKNDVKKKKSNKKGKGR